MDDNTVRKSSRDFNKIIKKKTQAVKTSDLMSRHIESADVSNNGKTGTGKKHIEANAQGAKASTSRNETRNMSAAELPKKYEAFLRSLRASL